NRVFGDDPFITRQFAQIHDSSMLGPTAPDTLFTKSARIARYTHLGLQHLSFRRQIGAIGRQSLARRCLRIRLSKIAIPLG
ncbi:MAG TPA: hypothetical protein VHY37_00305, partial [Tepidisphaeraceae bacterium]|nr:hypothetical protein [Tepidisphaeraceae bacterium]